MSAHPLDQAVFGAVLPEDINWEPFPAFPPSARLAVVVGDTSQAASGSTTGNCGRTRRVQ